MHALCRCNMPCVCGAQQQHATETEETCTQYNMLKVARYLFRWTGAPGFADYYERAILNGAARCVSFVVHTRPSRRRTSSNCNLGHCPAAGAVQPIAVSLLIASCNTVENMAAGLIGTQRMPAGYDPARAATAPPPGHNSHNSTIGAM